ncbi:hypothetical protein PI125_g21953 [Phytophthora idaei]|nr:hypothetical protein PI125_g21953 [Phytophthora idaei]KAG3159956.1 hypothetical protein PI126_g7124 [Phytophthora idaei]
MVQGIGMSELVSNGVVVGPERSSPGVRGAARYPESGASLASVPLLCPDEDKSGVARNPLSGTDLINARPLRAPESRRGVGRIPPSGVSRMLRRCVARGTRSTVGRGIMGVAGVMQVAWHRFHLARVINPMALSCVSRETRTSR